MEGVKLYQIMGSQQKTYQKAQGDFWKRIENMNCLPERQAESIKNFWKKYGTKSIEDYLIESLFHKHEFSLNFKKIPSEDFEARFRHQFQT